MRYLPLKPKLQSLFTTCKTAELMSWHANDGVDRHLADSPAWKDFDRRHARFASDGRNVRLGLVVDGFNPFILAY